MRDGTLIQMHEANAKRNALLLGQFEFLETRQSALEGLLKASRLHDRLRWVLFPRDFLKHWDDLQLVLLSQRRRQLEAAAAAGKTKARLVMP